MTKQDYIFETEDQLESAGYKRHHSATARGYLSRKCRDGVINPYSGRFGTGYTVEYPRWDTTQYHTIIYYTK